MVRAAGIGLTQPVQAIQVPPTVQAILAARIDRLAPGGQASPPGRLRRRQGRAVRAAPGDRRSTGRGAPPRTRIAPGRRVPLRDRALSGPRVLLQARAHRMRSRTAPCSRTGADPARPHRRRHRTLLSGPADRARRAAGPPCRAGEVWEQAVTYLHQAGVKALARSANREAVTCFEQALTALGHLPETRETLEQAIDLRFDLRTALFPLGEFERIFGCLREAEGLARTLDDQRRLGADVRLHVPQPLDDWSSDGSARVRPERPGHRRVARGCSAPGDGKSLPRRGLHLDGGLSTGRGSSPESPAVARRRSEP